MRNEPTSSPAAWFLLSALSAAAAPALAQAPPGGSVVNVASAEIPTAPGSPPVVLLSNPVFTPVAASLPLRVTKSCDPSGTLTPGAQVTFSLQVENPSGVALTGVVVTDPLDPLLLAPTAFTTGSVSDAGPGGGLVALTGTYDAASRILRWDAPVVPAGARFTLTFTAAIDPSSPDDAVVRNVSRQTSDQDPAGTESNEVVLAVVAPALSLDKRASRDRAEVGDPIGYTILAGNVSATLDLRSVKVTDLLPDGFRYREGSARLDGVSIADPGGAARGGRSLLFDLGDLPLGAVRRITYVAVPSPRSDGRDAANQAWAEAATPAGAAVRAGPARAVVRVSGSLLSGEAVVLGRVFLDDDRDGVFDEGEAGVPAVRVYLEDGTYTLTDVVGKYHIEGVRPGLHVVKVDQATLPEGLGPVRAWSRSAGTPGTAFTDVGPDQLFKANVALGGFGIGMARLRARAVYRKLGRGTEGEEISELQEVVFPPLPAAALFEPGTDAPKRSAPAVVQAYAAMLRERGGRLASLEVEPASYPLADEALMVRRAELLRADLGRLILAEARPAPPAAGPAAGAAPGRPPAERAGGPVAPPGALEMADPVAAAVASGGGTSRLDAAAAAGPQATADLAALEAAVSRMTAEPEIVAPAAEVLLPAPRGTVDVKLPAGLTPRLRVNGETVGNDQIAVRVSTSRSGAVFYRYLGVPLREGRNTIVLEGLDQWGSAVAWVERIARRVGRPGRVELTAEEGRQEADGRTPARVRAAVADADGLPVVDGTLVTLESDGAGFVGRDADAGMEGFQASTRDGAAVAMLAPSARVTEVTVRARAGEVASEATVPLQPELRPWIVAGVGEANVGRRGPAVTGGPGGPTLADLLEEDGGASGRMALFARGRIFGASSLTMAYDSGRSRDRDEVFRRIAPDRFFPVYGDGSIQGNDVESQGKLSLKLQQPRSSLTVGDFTTSLAGGDLLRYDRALTGGAGAVAVNGFTVQSFGATTPQSLVRDELAGGGISGPYRLTRRPVVIGSERVTLETRDRFHPERLLDARPMARFADYAIDYENGAVLFKQPVGFQDDAFNPVAIVVLYEVLGGSGRETVAGGRVGYRLGGLGALGATYVTEGREAGAFVLRGVDLGLKRALGAGSLEFSGEAAASQTSGDDPAGAVSLRAAAALGRSVTFGATYRNVAAGFGNPSRAGAADVGTLRWGVDGAAKLPGGGRLKGEVFSQEDDLRAQRRRVGALDFERSAGRLTVRSGLMDLRALDPISGEIEGSRLVSAGLGLRLGERFEGSARRQQVVWGAALQDYPTRTALGLSWRLTEDVRSFLRQELDQSDAGDAARTVLGMESRITRDTVVESRYSIEDSLAGSRGQAHLGVRTKLPLDGDWRGDVSAERVATARGASTGDFTAAGVGFEYLPARVKFTTRYEIRLGTEQDEHVLTAGGATRLTGAVSLFSRQRLFVVNPADGGSRVDGDGLVGLAFRPVADDRLNVLFKMQGVKGDGARGAGAPAARSYLGTLEANYQPVARLHLMSRLALKDSRDVLDAERYSTRSWLGEARALVDLGARFNAGLAGRLLRQAATGSRVTGIGVEGGWQVLPDVWLVGGYNVTGFGETGFGDGERRNAGPFLTARFKFDEETLVGLSRRLSAAPAAPGPRP